MMGRITTLALALCFGLIACGEAEVEEVPETAEMEDFDTGAEPGEALELDEETFLGPDDIGEDIMATGWVVGLPLQNGFFLRTEDDRVIFVESDRSVQPGETVRAMGPLAGAEAVVFEGWETDAFDAGFEAEWDVETVVYIDAYSVLPVDGVGEEGQTQAGPESDTIADDERGTDPGSKTDPSDGS